MTNEENTSITIKLADESATQSIAVQISNIAKIGDIIALIGDLGCGKTTFARAFINARTAVSENVPSPTFTLLQTYAFPSSAGPIPVFHFDLYRIESIDEIDELGMDDAFLDGISLIEWPERLGGRLPSDRLDVILNQGEDANDRRATLNLYGSWTSRIHSLITDTGKND
jgi:tRNA threonylcarbamoyladenosine biosynthesis protein TsaE